MLACTVSVFGKHLMLQIQASRMIVTSSNLYLYVSACVCIYIYVQLLVQLLVL